jgi:TonB family protein
MTSRPILFPVLSVALLLSTAFANKKVAEAAALIEHAKQLSDIRAEGAPAFRLKLSFKTIKEDGTVRDGSYTEVWVSRAQWRRETVLGDFRRTQIAAGRKQWVLDSTSAVPEHIGDILSLSQVDRFGADAWKPGKIEAREIEGRTVRCIETNPDLRGARSALCFENGSGVVAAEVRPLEMGTRIVDKACFFSDYQKFGDRVLARSYECDEDRHPRLQARIVELAFEPAPDSALFAPLDGAKESVNCLSVVKAPSVVHQQDPTFPRTSGGQARVTILMLVGIDGKPSNLKVANASNHNFDQAALEAAQRWRFKPATCDGEPVETEIAVEVSFISMHR